MRDVLKSRARWLQAGWILPLALLVLPNCGLDPTGFNAGEPPLTFDAGDAPRTSAVMCDIPKPVREADECASDAEILAFPSLSYAAIALAQGELTNNSIGLDYSSGSACGDKPKRVEFFGPFPHGLHVCLNCAQITQAPAVYADANAVCVAKCVDLVIADGNVPEGGAQSYCEANAKVATNFNEICYEDACTDGGMPKMPFDDPRRFQEPVKWDTLQGQASVMGDELRKLMNVGAPDDWDSGAASDQTIENGDAWVEFGVKEIGKSHVLGVSTGAIDTTPNLTDINFAVSLNNNNNVYILEDGAEDPSEVIGPFGQYQPVDRFRIRIKDNNDGTATISAWRLKDPAACMPGMSCLEDHIATYTKSSLSYPLRINASFREDGATIKNVTVVRIQKQP
jgi:hypothetical protein